MGVFDGVGVPTRPRNGLSLCAGGGGLDMGLMLAEPGFHTRCWVEIEGYPRSTLIAGMHTGYFAPAPVWDDLTTFDGRPWRGHIDTILAGYPCQPFSAAGQRKGENDERHLWPDVARVIGEIHPRWVFLENVEGHLSLGLDAVLDDLRRLGYCAATGLFSSEETGGSQVRKRVFIVGHRDEHDASAEREFGGGELGRDSGDGEGCRRDTQEPVAICEGGAGGIHEGPRRPDERARHVGGVGGETVAESSGELSDRSRSSQTGGRRDPSERCGSLDIACCHGGKAGVADSPTGQEGRSAEPIHSGRPLLAPPLPGDIDGWRFVVDLAPDLAPALSYRDIRRLSDIMAQGIAAGSVAEAEAESVLRRVAHALAARSRALRLLGNGVDPMAAGHAWRTLALAHGLRPVDLAADNTGGAV